MNAPFLGSNRRSRRGPVRIFSIHVLLLRLSNSAWQSLNRPRPIRILVSRTFTDRECSDPDAPNSSSYSLDATTDSRNRASHPRSESVSLSLPVAKSTLCKSSPRAVLS
jgi:hypothetical protein